MNRIVLSATLLLALAACSPEGKDYAASGRCQDLGNKPGTKAYEDCLTDEKMHGMMEQQQQEFDNMKQEQRDWSMRRY